MRRYADIEKRECDDHELTPKKNCGRICERNTTNQEVSNGCASPAVQISIVNRNSSSTLTGFDIRQESAGFALESGKEINVDTPLGASYAGSTDSELLGCGSSSKGFNSGCSSISNLTEISESDNLTDSAVGEIDFDVAMLLPLPEDLNSNTGGSSSTSNSRNKIMEDYQRMEHWLDSHPEFVMEYFGRKQSLARFADGIQNRLEPSMNTSGLYMGFPGAAGSSFRNYDPSMIPTLNSTMGSSSTSCNSSGAATPVRRISTQEFDRSGHMLTRMVQTVGGVPSFLSPTTDPRIDISTPGAASSFQSAKPRKSLSELKDLDEHQLMQELIMDICKDLDIRRLCHKILKNVCLLLKADRCSLFLVQQSQADQGQNAEENHTDDFSGADQQNEKFCEERNQGEQCVEENHHNADGEENSDANPNGCKSGRYLVSTLFDVEAGSILQEETKMTQEIRVPMGTGIVGYVAETGEALNIPDAYQDARFNKDVDRLTGYKTHSILCMPVLDTNGQVIAVAQAINKTIVKHEPFSEQDEKIFSSYLAFCGIGLHNAQMYERSTLENRRNQLMLDLAWVIFEEQRDVATLINKILLHTVSLLRCQRCQLLLVEETNPIKFSQAFDIQASDLENDSSYHPERKQEQRFPINTGIVSHVASTGETLNIADAYQDERFDPSVEEDSEFRTRTILCMPIKNAKGHVIGVVQLTNKLDDTAFNRNDENLFEAFAIFCGMGINNTRMYEQAVKAMARQRVVLEVLSYHCTATQDEVQSLKKFVSGPVATKLNLSDYRFDDAWLNDDGTLKTVYIMFQDLRLIENFRIPYDVFLRWMLTVKKNYRSVAYHNWRHAFNVTQTMYAMTQSKRMRNVLSDLEILALMVGCLSHDLDHRGTNNQFQVKSTSALAELYSTSIMEWHHYEHCVRILTTKGTEIFCNLTEEDNRTVISLLREAILATDLSLYFKHRDEFFRAVESESTITNAWTHPGHRSLLRGMMMTACDLSAITKPWPIQKKVAYLLADEFFEQGDIEKTELHIKPMDMMDRDNTDQLPAMQIKFIDSICMPIYEAFATMSDDYRTMLVGCRTNRDKWLELADGSMHKIDHEDRDRENEYKDDTDDNVNGDDAYSTAV